MTEWGVVLVIVSLVGLGGAVIKPVVTLTTTITKLTVVVDQLQQDMSAMTSKNSASHGRIFEQLEEHDHRIEGHEGRIIKLEEKV